MLVEIASYLPGSAHTNCRSPLPEESSPAAYHAQPGPHFGPVRASYDSGANASGSANLRLVLPLLTGLPVAGLGLLQVTVGGSSAKISCQAVQVLEPYNLVVKIKLPNSVSPAQPMCIVLTWTSPSGSRKSLTVDVREFEQDE